MASVTQRSLSVEVRDTAGALQSAAFAPSVDKRGGGSGTGAMDVCEAALAGYVFTLRREAADGLGFPGCDLHTLSVRQNGSRGEKTPPSAQGAWPFAEVKIKGFALHSRTQAVHAGGWQCWSESPFLGANETLAAEAFPEREIFGDAPVFRYPQRPGEAHSWSVSYSQIEGAARNAFFAAIDEDLFFARFDFALAEKCFAVAFDTEGAALNSMIASTLDSTLCDRCAAWIAPRADATEFAPLADAARAWMRAVRTHERVPRVLDEAQQAPRRSPVRGYTSWYLHYNSISTAILSRNLSQVAEEKGLSVFQIDDGYQKQIGDWLTPSKGFAEGDMRALARNARDRGLSPGLWCAPFIVAENSALWEAHPEWRLKTEAGKDVLCGDHPLWGGRFYALDTENAAFREHIEHVLETCFSQWGFAFLKADFLYAAARIPAGGLTRAQRSARAHEFLYRICVKHGARLLSCGSVLSSAALRCDYSRIGPDAGESWENEEMGTQPSREKVSTRASIVNTLSRGFFGGALFGSDPDVFFLRDHNIQMSPLEKETLATVNFAVGDLVFTSDELARWSGEAQALHARLASDFDARARAGKPLRLEALHIPEGHSGEAVLSARFVDGKTLTVNLSDAPVTLKSGEVRPHGHRWE